jgi:hypothetical protein
MVDCELTRGGYVEDWLADPLMKYIKADRRQQIATSFNVERWWSFHLATRLKLDGAVYFCTQVLGAAKLPIEVGLPTLIDRQRAWFGDSFLLHLHSACETLLQEINVVYGFGLRESTVKWRHNPDAPNRDSKFKKKLDQADPTLSLMIQETREEDWYKDFTWHRNHATHHYFTGTDETTSGGGEGAWGWDTVEVKLVNWRNGERRSDNIGVLTDYLQHMISHIHSVWTHMAPRFEPTEATDR